MASFDSGTTPSPSQPEIFVGREEELNLFRELVFTPSKGVRVLSISGPGGSGKTKLLLQMAEICRREGIRFLMLDFYDTKNRFWEGLLSNIVEALGREHFSRFHVALKEYDTFKRENREKAQQLWMNVEQAFAEDANQLLSAESRPTVALLDTYELLFEVRSNVWQEALRVVQVLANSVIVLTGRQPIPDPDRFTWALERYEARELHWFNLAETMEYFSQKCLREGITTTPEEVTTAVRRIFELSGGRPIHVAVATDWVVKRRLSIRDDLTKEQFDQFLAEFVHELVSADLDQLIIYIAHFYRRFDEEVLDRIELSPEHIDLNRSVPEALDELGQYAFIKYRKDLGRNCLLHDEWRALMIKHFWEKQDQKDGEKWRRGLSRAIVEWYYDWKIQQAQDSRERQALRAERTYYQLHSNFEAGYAEFAKLFDEALQDFRLHRFCGLLLDEFDTFEKDFSSRLTQEDRQELQFKRVRLRAHQYLWQDVIQLSTAILESGGSHES